MLSRNNPIALEAILQQQPPMAPIAPASDRAAWARVRNAIGPERVAAWIAQAEQATATPIPSVRATLYLRFKRDGDRQAYEEQAGVALGLIAPLAIAECLEYRGRFLDPLLDAVWALCELSTWAAPAHLVELADVAHPMIDLYSAEIGLVLAELLVLLGPELDPAVGRRIRYEVEQRLIAPFLARHDHPWMFHTAERPSNNWTAVCNGCVVSAALHLVEDPARLAEIVARGARSLDDYLATFDRDGGTVEGPGYWAYGFSHFTLLAQLLEQRTAARVSFWDQEPRLRRIAEFPMRVQLSPGAYANFSDCNTEIECPGALLVYLARRLDLPSLLGLEAEQPQPGYSVWNHTLPWALRNLFWYLDGGLASTPATPSRHDWFDEMQWMIARLNPADPQSLVLAAKGGNNGESHNQNDVGSVIVHAYGESLVADPGPGYYCRDYFNERRYGFLAAQSLGHSLPVPNGQQQRTGAEAAAHLLEHTAGEREDRLVLDLKDAYPPEARLTSLRRTAILRRDVPGGRVELVDEATFLGEPGTLESVLITFAEVELGEGAVRLRGQHGALRVGYDAQRVTPRVELVRDAALDAGPTDVTRVIFRLNRTVLSGDIRLWLEPAPR
ncbi:MAG: heparinase II/III family protein [Anaerolineae bacterium]